MIETRDDDDNPMWIDDTGKIVRHGDAHFKLHWIEDTYGGEHRVNCGCHCDICQEY